MVIQISVKEPEKPKLVSKWGRKENMVQKITQGNPEQMLALALSR